MVFAADRQPIAQPTASDPAHEPSKRQRVHPSVPANDIVAPTGPGASPAHSLNTSTLTDVGEVADSRRDGVQHTPSLSQVERECTADFTDDIWQQCDAIAQSAAQQLASA